MLAALTARGRALVVVALIGIVMMLTLALPPRLFGEVDVGGLPQLTDGGLPTVPDSARRPVRLRFQGVEVEVLATGWFLGILTLVMLSGSRRDDTNLIHGKVLLFGGAVVGLAAAMWIAWDGGLGRATRLPMQYWVAAGCVGSIFVLASQARLKVNGDRRLSALLDFARIAISRATWGAVALVLALAFTRPASLAERRAPTTNEFLDWFVLQPRQPGPRNPSTVAVTLFKFVDYQCAACRSAEEYYAPLMKSLAVEHPDAFEVKVLDFPLDSECNEFVSMATRGSACEAAAAVRFARRVGGEESARSLVQWLWDNQRGLTPSGVFEAVGRLLGGRQLNLEYATLLEQVRADVRLGHELGVRATPTYFLNGVKLSFVPAASLKAAVERELRVSGSSAR